MKTNSLLRYYASTMAIFCIMLCLGSCVYADGADAKNLSESKSKTDVNNNVVSKELTTVIQINQKGKEAIVSYRGGAGQSLLRSLEVQLLSADNSTVTQSLGTRVGDQVVLFGTGCGDKVVVVADYYSGVQQVVASEILSVIQRVCKPSQEYVHPCTDVLRTFDSSMSSVVSLPQEKNVSVQIGNDIRTVEVSFRGGLGQDIVKSMLIFGYSADGTIQKQELLNVVGDSVRLTTDGCGIRVVVQVNYFDGTSYTIVDEVVTTYVR
jgi:hypothetical protein